MSAATPWRAAVLDDYQHAAARYGPWSMLADDVQTRFFHDHLHDPHALAARLRDFDIVCLMRERTPLDAATLDRLPRLRLIVTTGMANAAVDVAHAQRRGVTVLGTESFQSGTPELVWALILALARRLGDESASVRAGGWQTGVGTDLRRRVLGLVGLGVIGARVARVALAFDMRVLAWSPNLTAERALAAGVEAVDKKALFAQSDFVSVSIRLAPATRHLINAGDFAAMKRSAYLINTSRGPLIDEAALVRALQENWIAGAGLDVFDEEPLPVDHPLRQLPNVLATPHVGYVTEANYRQFFGQTVEGIRGWLDGRPPRALSTATTAEAE